MVIIIFRIVQKIKDTYIGRNYPDRLSITLGYVEEELCAIRFCNHHDNCEYYEVPVSNWNKLEEAMVEDNRELELLHIPVKKWEE